MSSISQKYADRLKTEGEKTLSFFKAIPPEKWGEQVYTDGENWSIHQILTHITQAEGSLLRLFTYIVEGGAGASEDFNLNDYNHRKVRKMQGGSPSELIRLFTGRRAKTVAWVSQLSDEELKRVGRHPFLGMAPVEDMIKLMYRHVQLHQRDIRKVLKSQST